MAEYQTLANASQAQRFEDVFDNLGLRSDQLIEIRESDSYGALLSALREAESYGFKFEKDLHRLVKARATDDAVDLAALLHGRIDKWIINIGSRRDYGQNLIAGLVPRAINVIDPDLERALLERENAMELNATKLAEKSIKSNARWITELGPPPGGPSGKKVWLDTVSMVAAYREYWGPP